jgi:hypothetical protein
MNKIENASADVGENVVDIVQPIIERISELVGEFAKLDEETQTRWVKIAGGLILFGPAAVGVGNLAKGIGGLLTHIGKVKAGDAVGFFGALSKFIATPVGTFAAAMSGALLLAAGLNSIKTPSETIVENLRSIKVTLDPKTYKEAEDGLRTLQAYSDALSGVIGEHNKNVSSAVKAGYGTSNMYGEALGYEAIFTQNQITGITGKYAEQIDQLNGAIGAETDKGNQAAAARLAQQRDDLQTQWDAEVAAARASYMDQVNALISGMLSDQPEALSALERASKDYDLFALLQTALQSDAGMYEGDPIWKSIFTQDVLNRFFGGKGFEEIIPTNAALVLNQALQESLQASYATLGGEGSLAYTLLQSLLDDPLASGLFDITQTKGILDGLVEVLDFAAAGETAGRDFWGTLSPGLNDAIIDSIPGVDGAMVTMQDHLVSQAAAMARAVAAAFNGNLNFNMPNPTGGSTNLNLNSGPTAQNIYAIRKGLTDASRRAARGYGAG